MAVRRALFTSHAPYTTRIGTRPAGFYYVGPTPLILMYGVIELS